MDVLHRGESIQRRCQGEPHRIQGRRVSPTFASPLVPGEADSPAILHLQATQRARLLGEKMRPQLREGETNPSASQELLAHTMDAPGHEVLSQEQLEITAKLVIELHLFHGDDSRRAST